MPTINLPSRQDLRESRDKYSGSVFFVVVATAILCAIAGAKGWIPIPDVSAFGLIVLLGALALIIFLANRQAAVWRNLAWVVAMIFGIVVTVVWGRLWPVIVDLGWLKALVLLGAIVALMAIAAFCAYKRAPVVNDQN